MDPSPEPLSVPELRQALHRCAETAFEETKTATTLRDFLLRHGVTVLATDVAGHGILARAGPEGPGPLFRAELDALPVPEATGLPHAADTGAHHACGHDGHMAMLAGAMARLARRPPRTVYAFFQPAEETGAGAARALRDERMDLPLTSCYALHNVPGLPLASLHVRPGVAAPGSSGFAVRYRGATSHAGEPDRGRSPVRALTALAAVIDALPSAAQGPALATIVGLSSGGPRYGTAPGDGELHATLRAHDDDELERMLLEAEHAARRLGDDHGLQTETDRVDPFPATRNAAQPVAAVHRAAHAAELPIAEPGAPVPWSEDFGHFLHRWPGALVLIGSGTDQPDLHSPTYDFPDALLEPGIRFWTHLAEVAP